MTKLISTSLDSFLARTKSALELFTGSPIKSDAKVRQFLTHQLSVNNEHMLSSAFTSGVYVLNVDPDNNEEMATVTLYSNIEKLAEGIRDAYLQECSKIDISEQILDIKFFRDAVSEHDDGGELQNYSNEESVDWLIAHFSIDDLCGQVIDELTDGACQIGYRYQEVI